MEFQEVWGLVGAFWEESGGLWRFVKMEDIIFEAKISHIGGS